MAAIAQWCQPTMPAAAPKELIAHQLLAQLLIDQSIDFKPDAPLKRSSQTMSRVFARSEDAKRQANNINAVMKIYGERLPKPVLLNIPEPKEDRSASSSASLSSLEPTDSSMISSSSSARPVSSSSTMVYDSEESLISRQRTRGPLSCNRS